MLQLEIIQIFETAWKDILSSDLPSSILIERSAILWGDMTMASNRQ